MLFYGVGVHPLHIDLTLDELRSSLQSGVGDLLVDRLLLLQHNLALQADG